MSGSVEKSWQRASRYLQEQQFAAARAVLESMQRTDTDNPRTHLLASRLFATDGRARAAAEAALAASRKLPGNVSLRLDAVDALMQSGETVAVRDCLGATRLDAATPDELLRAAVQWQSLGMHEASLDLLEQLHQRGFDNQQVAFHRGVQFGFRGELDRAGQELERSAAMPPPQGRAFVELARLRRQTPQRNHLASLRRCIAQTDPRGENHAALQFALYKELEDLGQYDEAWQALEVGNAVMRARLRPDPDVQKNLVDGMIDGCDRTFMQHPSVEMEGPQPIFIVGLPRSGTTLLERILGNHSQVKSAGELPDFGLQLAYCANRRRMGGREFLEALQGLDFGELGRRYLAQTQWRADDRAYYLDKQPSNWTYAGLIHRALPQARILHMVREPLDVCFSNYRAFFGSAYAYSYDFTSLARHHADYRRLAAHWQSVILERMLEVSYSELVQDPESTARKVFAFCGLPWQEGCLDLSRNPSPVATLSLAQTRDAIRADMGEAWRPYAERIAGLRTRLDETRT